MKNDDMSNMEENKKKPTYDELLNENYALKATVAKLEARIETLDARLEKLEAMLRQNSRNSSKPPSSDMPSVPPKKKQKTSKRKQGGQRGHKGHYRKLLPQDEVESIVEIKPDLCMHCGCGLSGNDQNPRRHQVLDIPKPAFEVSEYRLHSLHCDKCGQQTRAELPRNIPRSAFGHNVQSTIAMATGSWRMSKRTVAEMLDALFGIKMSLASISACEKRVSAAISQSVEEVQNFVRRSDVVYADETSWRENNNKFWLWAGVAKEATMFFVQENRSQVSAKKLLGDFNGVLVSDRYGAYNIHDGLRQLCWAHLKRDFIAFSENKCKQGLIGKLLLKQVKNLFSSWHQFQSGIFDRSVFQEKIYPVVNAIKRLLEDGSSFGKTKMARSCRRILKQFSSLWTFTYIDEVEPTNNSAERAVRPAVIWRKNNFGTQSTRGSRFIERIMTTVSTLKQQNRNLFEFLLSACNAHQLGLSPPSLIPA